MKIAVVWGKWGPYHHARFNALVRAHGRAHCLGVALAGKSSNYQWADVTSGAVQGRVVTLNPDAEQETLPPLKTGRQLYRLLRKEGIDVVFLPSYWPARSLAILLFARLAGVRCVMMNESHAATEKARGAARWVKKRLLGLFHAGLVGGTPHVAHFTRLGMPADKLFIGYDTVDNDYFSRSAGAVAGHGTEVRTRLGLPLRYVLNLGRMVGKKNLALLIDAYAAWAGVDAGTASMNAGAAGADKNVALVLVGSGPLEPALRAQAAALGLRVASLEPGRIPDAARTVFFGGFRQIDENPLFFTLADVFVLPSHTEEWGLVVNEAMACGAPVLVSIEVGSAPDLVRDGYNGYQFDPADEEALTGLLDLVLTDDALRTKMGQHSRELIRGWGCDLFATGVLRAANAALNTPS
jgi:glycosyltransferase involved in cell wall biosynthesis